MPLPLLDSLGESTKTPHYLGRGVVSRLYIKVNGRKLTVEPPKGCTVNLAAGGCLRGERDRRTLTYRTTIKSSKVTGLPQFEGIHRVNWPWIWLCRAKWMFSKP